MKPAPTMADVAKLAGVSAMTVSRALRHDGSVSHQTRARVLEVIEEIGYVPDQAAGALSSGRSGLVAAIVPTLTVPPFAQIARGLNETLMAEGYQLFLGFSDYSADREEQILKAIMRRRPEAIAVAGSDHSERTVRLLENAGIPVIEVFKRSGPAIGHAMAINQAEIGRAAVKHLVSRGKKKIAIALSQRVAEPGEDDRLEGVISGAREFGAPPPLTFRHGDPLGPLDQGLRAAAELVDRAGTRCDALICMNDYVAVGAIGELKRRGLKVPADVAVFGFGDYDVARHVDPAVTTIGFSAVVVGVEIGKLMLTTLEAARVGRSLNPYRLNLEFQLMERESA